MRKLTIEKTENGFILKDQWSTEAENMKEEIHVFQDDDNIKDAFESLVRHIRESL